MISDTIWESSFISLMYMLKELARLDLIWLYCTTTTTTILPHCQPHHRYRTRSISVGSSSSSSSYFSLIICLKFQIRVRSSALLIASDLEKRGEARKEVLCSKLGWWFNVPSHHWLPARNEGVKARTAMQRWWWWFWGCWCFFVVCAVFLDCVYPVYFAGDDDKIGRDGIDMISVLHSS